MEEEGARRRAYNGRGGAGPRGFLPGLNEGDEDSEVDDESVLSEARHRRGEANGEVVAPVGAGSKAVALRNLDLAGSPAIVNVVPDRNLWDGRAGPRDRGRRVGGAKGFELDIDNATLLGRRSKKHHVVTGTSSVAQHMIPSGSEVDATLASGSPMRIV
jgi:hypothetical protein